MGDFVFGPVPPDSEEEWLLDGSPFPPFRRTISRRDIATSFGPPTTVLNVYAVPVQVGDIFIFVSFLSGASCHP